MNHLAHALASGRDESLILGGFLGDFVHGGVDPGLPDGIRRGLRLHRAIDVYTDHHPIIVRTRSWFRAPYRRYAGIIIDIWFDHLLARDFERWSRVPLEVYSHRVLALLQHHRAELPEQLQRFLHYMVLHDLPLQYREREQIQRVLEAVGRRLAHENPLASSLGEIERLELPLRRAFEEFFPRLLAFAVRHRRGG